jgi:hypothetical protein
VIHAIKLCPQTELMLFADRICRSPAASLSTSVEPASRLIGRIVVTRLLDAGTGWETQQWEEDSTASSNHIASVAHQRQPTVLVSRRPLRMSFRYRVVCNGGYYGPGCSTSCVVRNDRFGHYVCSENGTKVCMDGWTGLYCDRRECSLIFTAIDVSVV